MINMASAVILVILSAIAGYFVSGLIVAVFMGKYGYEKALTPMIRHVLFNNQDKRGLIDEETAMQAIALNIQARMLYTLASYATITIVILFLWSSGEGNQIKQTMLLAAFMGMLLSCLGAMIGESKFRAQFLQFKYYDKNKPIFDILFNRNDERERRLNIKDDSEQFYTGDIIVAFLMPTGETIYDWLE